MRYLVKPYLFQPSQFGFKTTILTYLSMHSPQSDRRKTFHADELSCTAPFKHKFGNEETQLFFLNIKLE